MLLSFPPFDAFIIVVSLEKRRIQYIKIQCNKRKTNATFKGNKEIM
jgi:hypothetical protein